MTFNKIFIWEGQKCCVWKTMSIETNYISHLPGANVVIMHKLSKIKLNNLNPIKRQKTSQQGESIQNVLVINKPLMPFLVSGYLDLEIKLTASSNPGCPPNCQCRILTCLQCPVNCILYPTVKGKSQTTLHSLRAVSGMSVPKVSCWKVPDPDMYYILKKPNKWSDHYRFFYHRKEHRSISLNF